MDVVDNEIQVLREKAHAKLGESQWLIAVLSSTLLHYLVVECRMSFAYFSVFTSTMYSVAPALNDMLPSEVKHELTIEEFLSEGNLTKESLAETFHIDYQACLAADLSKAFEGFGSLLSIEPYNGRCLHVPYNIYGKACMIMQVLCLGMITVQVLIMFLWLIRQYTLKRYCSFESGRYMAFCWDVLESKPHQITVNIVFGGSVIMVVGIVAVAIYRSGDAQESINFFASQGVGLVLMIISAFGMKNIQRPLYAKDDDFVSMCFRRNVLDLFTQSNDSFSSKFQHALYRAQIGSYDEIKATVEPITIGAKDWDDENVLKFLDLLRSFDPDQSKNPGKSKRDSFFQGNNYQVLLSSPSAGSGADVVDP